ncbi:ABC transporter permease [Proteinivorax tanatarense]|uniref:ABC transporter permease n=1 Tax=Proteinivorax tanatarense TaxID=1260629 RepID=A0AAU7VQC3_9FIRM
MKIFTIAYYTCLRNLRDISSSMYMVAYPILLILILGNALQNDFEVRQIDTVKVSVLNEEKTYLGEAFEQFISTVEKEELISVDVVYSYDEGINKIESGDKFAFIHLPAQLEEGRINTYSKHEQGLNYTIFTNIMNSFIKGAIQLML